jgi:hypothetical protein
MFTQWSSVGNPSSNDRFQAPVQWSSSASTGVPADLSALSPMLVAVETFQVDGESTRRVLDVCFGSKHFSFHPCSKRSAFFRPEAQGQPSPATDLRAVTDHQGSTWVQTPSGEAGSTPSIVPVLVPCIALKDAQSGVAVKSVFDGLVTRLVSIWRPASCALSETHCVTLISPHTANQTPSLHGSVSFREDDFRLYNHIQSRDVDIWRCTTTAGTVLLAGYAADSLQTWPQLISEYVGPESLLEVNRVISAPSLSNGPPTWTRARHR